jgi:hypothetical protein
MAECKKCIHEVVCESAKSCDGRVPGCEHFKEERIGVWLYTGEIDEDGNVQANCSLCGAGDKHAESMVGKVPYCWKCGADMKGE